MKKLLLSLAVALATLTSVHAEEITGIVAGVDADNMVIMLQDDTEIDVAEGVSLDELEEGTNVTIITNDEGVATEILIAE